ncbi:MULTISPECIES: GerAB/ArcD/ProY family transporter [Paenibacillus]|uniref:GerAB/ArcD/ProY family transporter n=1 Tax=Paenibacillus TaxID=44249 RepID=UPI0022B910A7|nr:endospore germination permease [Paenibacillus caseinilyticus]MCZ8520895.1 endospore germination permease [Paenibacillus caseinilyticus]
MQNQVKISNRQLIVLVTLYVIGDSILVLPSFPAMYAKEDAWISGLIGLAVGLLLVYLLARLGKLHPEMNLYEYSSRLLGKRGGQAAAVLFSFYFFLMVSAEVREMGDFMTTQIMPLTPIQSVQLLFLFIVVLGGRLGIETVARAGELLFPHFFLLFFMLAACLLPKIDLQNVMVPFSMGVKPILYGSLTAITFPFAEAVCILSILSSVNKTEKIPRSMLMGALIGGIVLEIIIILTIVVIGAPLTANQIYPAYSLAKKIGIGNFLERIEAILAIMWIITTFFKTVLNFYALMLGAAHLTRLNEPKLTTLPLGMMLLVSSIVAFPDIAYFNDLASNYWPFLDFTICLVLVGLYGCTILGKKA